MSIESSKKRQKEFDKGTEEAALVYKTKEGFKKVLGLIEEKNGIIEGLEKELEEIKYCIVLPKEKLGLPAEELKRVAMKEYDKKMKKD